MSNISSTAVPDPCNPVFFELAEEKFSEMFHKLSGFATISESFA